MSTTTTWRVGQTDHPVERINDYQVTVGRETWTWKPLLQRWECVNPMDGRTVKASAHLARFLDAVLSPQQDSQE